MAADIHITVLGDVTLFTDVSEKILSLSSGYNSILEFFTVIQKFLSSPVPAMTSESVYNANI
jgi:hypothetical protein